MLEARFALGKFWCNSDECRRDSRRHGRQLPGLLPSPAPESDLRRADGLIVMEFAGWQQNEDGEWCRVGKPHHTISYRKDQRARANTRLSDAGKKMEIWDPAEKFGRRAVSLPQTARCYKCGALNVLAPHLLLESQQQAK